MLNTTLVAGWGGYTIEFDEELNNIPIFCSCTLTKSNTGIAIHSPQCTAKTKTSATFAIYNVDQSPMVVDLEVFAICKA